MDILSLIGYMRLVFFFLVKVGISGICGIMGEIEGEGCLWVGDFWEMLGLRILV